MKSKSLYFFFALLLTGVVPVTAAEEDTADPEKISGKGLISSDVFGARGGYIHPFITLTEAYADNIYNTDTDKVSDFITAISPGLWLAVPRVKEELLDFDTSSMTPGGLDLYLDTGKDFKRIQTYLFYSPAIYLYSQNSDENFTAHKAEGMLQYNFRGDLTLELIDQYRYDMDTRGSGTSTDLDKYEVNFFTVRTSYDLTPKLEFRVVYGSFKVDYTASRNDYRDRSDNSYSAYAFYRFWPKTSFLAEYKHISVSYDDSSLVDGSHVDRMYGGFQWNMTAKSKGRIKLGTESRDYDDSAFSDLDEFIMEMNADYSFSPKTSLGLRAFRHSEETDIKGLESQIHNRINTFVAYKPMSRVTCYLDLAYSERHYNGHFTYNGVTKERDDTTYTITPSIEYRFREWLTVKADYYWIDRDSNFSDFDYTSNIFQVSITGML